MSITSTEASKPGRQYAYRINDAALVSGLCRSTLYNLMRRGELEFVEVGFGPEASPNTCYAWYVWDKSSPSKTQVRLFDWLDHASPVPPLGTV